MAAVRLGQWPVDCGTCVVAVLAWLAWSPFRVVIPTWDRTLGVTLSCIDETLRRIGGAPTYAWTDNEKTVTTEHTAGVPVRHPDMAAAGRSCGKLIANCIWVPISVPITTTTAVSPRSY